MTILFIVFGTIAILGTGAAMSLRSAVHCVLALAVGLVGIAALYLLLGAQFVGFTQIMVYVGAVAILAVFAIMTTQQGDERTPAPQSPAMVRAVISGVMTAAGVLGVLIWVIARSGIPDETRPRVPEASVVSIGDALMHNFVLPLEITGLLLTVAMVGAVIVAMPEKQGRS